MFQVIDRAGFVADRWAGTEVVAFPGIPEARAVHLEVDADPEEVAPHFARLDLIVIPFASNADGRGLSLAASLRALGYSGHLRARGHVLVDQFRAALRSGFSDVEIPAAQAVRMPEHQWRAVRHDPGYGDRVFTSRPAVKAGAG